MKRALSPKNLWEALPPPMRRMAGGLLRVVPLGTLLGGRFRAAHAFAREAEHWPAERSRAYQVDQLRELTRLAHQQSPYYRRAFETAGFDPNDLKSPEDLRRLPTIDKSTIREHLDELLTQPKDARGVDYTTTGGTGGNPLNFYINSSRSATEYGYLVASWERAGFRLGMPMAVLRGRVVKPGRDGVRHEQDPLLRHHYFSNFHTTDADLAGYLERIRGIGECVLHAYPSSAAALARFIRRSGAAPPANVRAILCESEIVYPEQRELVQRTFNRRLMACYGATEKLVMAAECEHSSRYHVWPTYGYCELLDEQGRPVTTPGQRGEIVGTGFINTVVPFIRYRTGDFATYVGQKCPDCDREHLMLEDIQGHRTQEYLVAADGSQISWTAMNMHDDTFDGVRQFQFVQSTPGRATLRLVKADGFEAEAEARIRRSLDRKFDGRMTVQIEFVGEIALSTRGKAIYVDQRISRRTDEPELAEGPPVSPQTAGR